MPSQSKIKDFCQLSHRESQEHGKLQFAYMIFCLWEILALKGGGLQWMYLNAEQKSFPEPGRWSILQAFTPGGCFW